MSGVLDTSMVVRYLTGDPPEGADKAARVIDHVGDLYLTDVVIAETAFVLTAVYRVGWQRVVDLLLEFVQKENIRTVAISKELMIQALLLCRPSNRVSFADAMVWAAAHATREKVVYTLDERFPSDGVKIRGS